MSSNYINDYYPPLIIDIGTANVKYSQPILNTCKLTREVIKTNDKEEDIINSLNVMQYPDMFVERYKAQQIEDEDPNTESIGMIGEMHKRGYKVFNYILDVNVEGECWQHVLAQYKLEYAANSKVVLLLGYDKANHETINHIVNEFAMGNNMPRIIPYASEYKLQYLKISDYFITNREAETGICVDYADMYNVKVLPALAQRIFQGIGK